MSAHPRGMTWNLPWEPADSPTERHSLESVVPIEEVVDGVVESNDEGAFFVVSETHELPNGMSESWPDNRGRRALTVLTGDEEFEAFELGNALFVDTETTGLVGGTGTYAFLVGCGWIESGALRVDQFFMRDHADEPALMAHLAGLVSRFDWTVSFNGRSFDLPLLDTRLIMNRIRTSLGDLGALDLLVIARRLWRYQFPRRDLETLEREILGIRREIDVPSYEIPDIYFRHLRTGDARGLVPVMAHNRQDIVSTVSLLARACEACRQWGGPNAHPAQVLGVARSFALAGDSQTALAAYARALDLGLEDRLQPVAQVPLSLAQKRAELWPGALELWETMRNRDGRGSIWALVELAKYQEHCVGGFAAARDYAVEALTRVDEFDGDLPEPLGRPALEHRLRRLERRLLASNPSPVVSG